MAKFTAIVIPIEDYDGIENKTNRQEIEIEAYDKFSVMKTFSKLYPQMVVLGFKT